MKPKLPDSAAKARKDIKEKGIDLMFSMNAEMAKQDEKHRVQLAARTGGEVEDEGEAGVAHLPRETSWG